jgi:hypothetical protein
MENRIRIRWSWARIPAGARAYSFLQNDQTGSGTPLASHSMDMAVLFRGVKRPGSDANHLPPPCVDVDNEWSYSSASPVCLHAVDSQKSTFVIV